MMLEKIITVMLFMLVALSGNITVASIFGSNVCYAAETSMQSSAYSYNSVEEMKNDLALQEGMYVTTSGYYLANDGGAGEYIIQSVKGISDISLNNKLYAHLIAEGEVDIRQFGAIGDGITDNTKAIQDACDSGYAVVVPNTGEDFLISRRISLINDIRFEGYMRMIANNGETRIYSCLLVNNYRGEKTLYIRNPLLHGGRDTSTAYENNNLEYAHGIRIIGSKNVIIEGGNITSMQGDGIVISGTTYYNYSENIQVKGTRISDSYRNNISIVSGKKIYIKDVYATSRNGYRNILIEPLGILTNGGGNGVIENIYIDGCTLYGGCETAVIDICSNIKIKDVTIANTIIDIQGTKTTCGVRHSNATGYDYIPEKVTISNTTIVSDNEQQVKQNLMCADKLILDNVQIKGHFKYIGLKGNVIIANRLQIENDNFTIMGQVNIKAWESLEISNSIFNARNITQSYSGMLNIEECPDIKVTNSKFLNNQNSIKVKDGLSTSPWVITSFVIKGNEFQGNELYPTSRAIVIGKYNTIMNYQIENNIYTGIGTQLFLQDETSILIKSL